jgi:hypothetical protein
MLFPFAQQGIFSSAVSQFENNFHVNIMVILVKSVFGGVEAWKLLSRAHGKLIWLPA